MPLSVTICTQEIYDAFYSSDKMKAFWHGHSYTGHPLACAVANASLDLLETETCKQTIQEIINAQEAFIVELKKISSVANIRQTGTILAWDIKVADAGYFSEIRDRLYDMAIEQGVLLRPLGNAIYILPPYCISREELSKAQQAGAAISRFVNTENT